MNLAIIDFEDSFTYNIIHSVEKNKGINIELIDYKKMKINHLNQFDKIILSPGAETPKEKNISNNILSEIINTKPILGICLGFQIIADFFGESLVQLDKPKHGVQSELEILQKDEIFSNLNSIKVGRYHSWSVNLKDKSEMIPLAKSKDDDCLMVFKHSKLPVYGVQFHPESILTPKGDLLLKNWIYLNKE
ncbi:MAG: aminodeoxychorismate/anthranilate synthase component II [Flavobacteriales bacterium]|nr:aminodeoxychorismate/anthranilate synthase component II [Flavobacteriales bacterium]